MLPSFFFPALQLEAETKSLGEYRRTLGGAGVFRSHRIFNGKSWGLWRWGMKGCRKIVLNYTLYDTYLFNLPFILSLSFSLVMWFYNHTILSLSQTRTQTQTNKRTTNIATFAKCFTAQGACLVCSRVLSPRLFREDCVGIISIWYWGSVDQILKFEGTTREASLEPLAVLKSTNVSLVQK